MQIKRITICIALAIAPDAFAADETLPEVVVTAPAMEEPLVVRTDPRKPRQPIPAHDGAEYLKTIPGFSVIRKGGTDGDPVFRGMAGSRLNILLDGEQILGGCGGRMDPPTAYVFPSSYDRITVLKGPQTVLYGPGSSAGTVLFERDFARRSESGMGGEGSATTGSFGRTDLMGDIHGGTPNAYGRAIYTSSTADDYRDGNGNSVHSAYSRWSTNAAIGLTPNDSTRVEVSMARSDGKAAYADRSVDGSKFARDNTGLKVDWKNSSHGTLDKIEVQLFHNYIDHVMDSYSLRSGGNPAGMMAAMNPDRTTNGGRLLGTLNLGEATQLKVGVDTQTNVHTGRVGAAPGYMGDYTLKPRVEDANFGNRGVFGEATHQLGDDARVVGGLRSDSWEAQDKRAMLMIGMASQMNPTANQTRNENLKSGFLRYEQDVMSNAGTVYAGLGHTERFPDYWELVGGNKESATTLSAFDTRPEKTNQLDAGMTYRQGDVSASLSGFYSKVSDFILIQSSFSKPNGMGARLTTITRNINAHTWGGEASIAWKLAQEWKVDGSLAYVRGKNETDSSELAQLSPLEGRIGATYDNSVWSVGGLLRMVAAQDRYVVNQGNIAGQDIGRTSGFSVLSLNAAYRAGKEVLLSAGVDNVTNRTYAEHISRAGAMVAGFTQTTRVNETGRNLWMKVNVKFD
jgi:iron complex outermembrane receptor protein